MRDNEIRVVLFDYGGVLAEEGFQNGLAHIARQFDLDTQTFFQTATAIIYSCGYVTGKTDEHHYWELLRQATGIRGADPELTAVILDRFVLRPPMVEIVRSLRKKGYRTAILSDQTDWLERLNDRDHFFPEFDAVFNSFHLKKTKRDPTIFSDILKTLQAEPGEALFIDDNADHIGRAVKRGLHTHLFTRVNPFLADLHYRGL